jgi:hypothetical protein
MIDLRLGRWQDVLADVTCDAIICDPPYGARTHNAAGDRGAAERSDGVSPDGCAPSYSHLTPDDIDQFLKHWSSRCSGWIVAMTDSDLAPVWQDAYFRHGRYGFAPIPCVIRGMTVRLAGDGPSSWAVYAVAGRPRSKAFASWGTLDGAYTGPAQPGAGGGRGKPAWLVNALVRDYSRSGDLVCDPFAGWGGTLAASVSLGRRAVGSEMDPAAFQEAHRRLARPLQVDMFGGAA